jgi:predicted enzyme related to lactoylglutathione lyase
MKDLNPTFSLIKIPVNGCVRVAFLFLIVALAGCNPFPSDKTELPKTPVFVSAIPNMIVKDVQGSADFYTTKLGFQLAGNGPGYAVLKRGDITLGLIAAQKDKAAGNSWCYLKVTMVPDVLEEFKANAVKVVSPLSTWGEHMEFTIEDLDGNKLDVGN